MESQNIEYKSAWRDEYLKWICAFANTDGGKLYIGVKDDGTVCGVDDAHKLSEDIPNKIRNTMGLICTVNLLSKEGLDYFEIITEKYPFPVSYHGRYYKRTGSTIQEVSGIELDKMILGVQGRTWDSVPVPHISVADLENDAIRLFKKKAKDSGRLDDDALNVTNETLIKNLHITEGRYLTRACMLAFHPDPEMWVTGAYIKVAYFENDADILYQDEIHGPLILQVEKTMELIYTKYMKALISYEGIYRKETFFFPKSAFRELLLNAVIHKDYLCTTPIQIRIYKDKIRLWNDGALPKEVPVEDLYKEHVSKPCNPNLANVFFKCGMIESWARGFKKITRYCEEENAKLPVIDLSLGGVTARCYASDVYLELMKEAENGDSVTKNDDVSPKMSEKMSDKTEKVSDKKPGKMSDKNKTRLVTVLNYLQTVESISSSQTADLLKIEIKAANRLLVKAVELGILEAQGSNKTRKYSVKKQQVEK